MCGVWRILLWSSVACLTEARRPRQSDVDADMMNIKMLGISVPGSPGEDYPIFSSVPSTSFSCEDKEGGGYYADMEAGCQVHHTCGIREDLGFIKFSTLCPNGTIFDQEGQTCRWWYLVNCQASDRFYFTETNIRGSEVSSVITQEASIPFSGDFESVAQFPTAAVPPRRKQATIVPPRRKQATINTNGGQGNRENSIPENTIYLAIPEGVLRDQLLNIQNSVSGSRRVLASGLQISEEEYLRAVPGDRRQIPARVTRRPGNQKPNRRPNPPRGSGPVATANLIPDRRTQQSGNNLINSGIQSRIEPENNDVEDDYYLDYDNDDRLNINSRPTLPPSKGSFSFRNGKIAVKSG
eukprot:GFUD01018176.1.p1 GENE.GFUD01018176.1~~GFUD01018176.1.p1  ORF type:complete len:362 (+),score=58.29 GFUD01018176.1:29-1087(+)